MALQDLAHEGEGGSYAPRAGHVAFKHCARLVCRMQEIDHLTSQLHVLLIMMLAPVPEPPHAVPPQPRGLVADVDTPLELEVLDVAQ
ncbi:hypothetical protein IQ25_01942 [Novosphingobium taihuense]|uniref:Uncharacterized protein n=1 Tax=Novosphingobium taihuense TaxID=260085 RepID=A0A7W7A9Q1_9SPHN|nr:hypothetical protein [Novosphingobium taihuense]TWH85188.1 hypothetical protein IQ25_01942 [Novosphingobium taihuense]